jgi:hypothetical protein
MTMDDQQNRMAQSDEGSSDKQGNSRQGHVFSEPPFDIEDTPIASPSLEEFPPPIRMYRADTKPRVEAVPEEVRAAAIFDRHLAQRHLVLFQSVEERIDYHPLPYQPQPDDVLLPDYPWRLILEMRVENRWMRLGVDLYDRVILGRGESRDGHVMINLNPYGAGLMGVSRIHLSLRPTSEGLVIADLNSTNGTLVNGESITPGIDILLPERCEIALGKLKMLLSVVERPKITR